MPVRDAAQRAPAETAARDTVFAGDLEVDRTPVTNARYARFVEATNHRPPLFWPNGECPASLRDHPVVGVDLFDAIAFALWAGGALPSELEWCEASGLEEPRAFVWGDDFDAARCNTTRSGLKGTAPVGSFPEGAAPSGALDLCGNVWEMTCTAGDEDQAILVKGGSWYDFPAHAKIDASFTMRAHKPGNTVGFRLVYGRPLRLPAFLDTVLVAQCIAFRKQQAGDGDAPGGEHGTGEFESILDELRAEAEPHFRGIELESAEEMTLQLSDHALALFDEAEAVPLEPEGEDEEADAADRELRVVVSEIALTLWARGSDLVSRHPKSLFLAACVAVGCVLGLALASTPDGADGRSGERGKALHIARRRAAAAVREGERERAARARRAGKEASAAKKRGARPSTKLDRTLKELLYGKPGAREEAERWLIWHADESYDRVRAALKTNVEPEVRSSLLYVLAAIEEQRGKPGTPVVSGEAPRTGLVYFLDRMDDSAARHVRLLRRTGAAEGVPVTVVIQGHEQAQAIARDYAETLRAVHVFPDEGGLKRALRVPRSPAIVGLGRRGRRQFVLVGTVPRAHLAKKTAQLK